MAVLGIDMWTLSTAAARHANSRQRGSSVRERPSRYISGTTDIEYSKNRERPPQLLDNLCPRADWRIGYCICRIRSKGRRSVWYNNSFHSNPDQLFIIPQHARSGQTALSRFLCPPVHQSVSPSFEETLPGRKCETDSV